SGGVHFSHWDIDQTIPVVTNRNGVTLTNDQVRAGVEAVCARPAAAKNCGQRVLHALSAVPFNLNSLEFFGSATAVLFADTDLTLAGDYYGYLQDATQEQYASLIFN